MTADADLVFETATAFWQSSVLFAACRLGVFDALAAAPGTAADLAGRLETSERGTIALLDACVAMGLLAREAAAYRNTETAAAYLTSSSPESLVVTLGLQAATYPMWERLGDAVKSGNPVIPPGDLLGGNPELTRRFVVGMHQRALGVGRALVDAVDLEGKQLLADIGGGPGTYSVLLARKYPGLRSRVMDLPPILAVSRELIDQSGVGDRIETVPCNAETDDFGEGFDAALVSGLLHRMTPEGCAEIFRKVYAGLAEGGIVAVNDLFTDREGGPRMAVLFGLQMLLTNRTGCAHSAASVETWLGQAGFRRVRAVTLPPPLPHTVLLGRKEPPPRERTDGNG